MAELRAKGPTLTPLSAVLSCTAFGAAQSDTSSVQTEASIAQCLNHRASALGCLYLREQVLDSSDRFICTDPSCCSLPGSQLSAEITQDKGGQHWPQTDATSVSARGPLCQPKTCKSSFLLQPVNSSPETLAHATSSSRPVISSQQARQTSETAVF